MKQRVYLASKFIIPTASKEVVILKSFMKKSRKAAVFPLLSLKPGQVMVRVLCLGFILKTLPKIITGSI